MWAPETPLNVAEESPVESQVQEVAESQPWPAGPGDLGAAPVLVPETQVDSVERPGAAIAYAPESVHR